MNDMQHLRTHLLMDLPSSRHAETSVGGYDDPDRGSGGSRNSAANNRWNNTERNETSRADYRYQRVRGDSSIDSANVAGGSRSVRSGLYDTEVCLSVSGLGNVRGTMVSGRTGKQVSFGRHSPGMVGTIERERSRESDGRDKRSVRDRASVSSNKENSENRSTFPRSSIVASKRPSPERVPCDPRVRQRDDSTSRRRNVQESSLTLPASRGRRDANRLSGISNEPTFDDLIDPKDVNLNEISRDCLIISVHLVHRFLPQGVTVRACSLLTAHLFYLFYPHLVLDT